MKIEKNKVVAIQYTLKDNDGVTIDTSEGRDPLAYLHGTGGLIPGLEKELEGKAKGDKFHAKIAAAEAYGERNEELLQNVPKEQLAHIPELHEGAQLQTNSNMGPMIVTVVKMTETEITLDGNHPLAGKELNFDVEVMEVREPTKEEVEHGHVHGPGGHQH